MKSKISDTQRPRSSRQDIRAMTVTDDATVFTNVEWEEGGGTSASTATAS